MDIITVVRTPEGGAPYMIRAQFYSLQMPLAENSEALDRLKGIIKVGDEFYFVAKPEVLKALRRQGKWEAAEYWDQRVSFEYMVFKKSDCLLNHVCSLTEQSKPFCHECGHMVGGF